VKNSTIRFIVVLATLCIMGITITQLYWVKRAFDLKESEFDRQANTALLNVAQQIFTINKTPSPANNPVTQVSTNYYVVVINGEIDPELLEFLLTTEFEKRNIKADFEYGIYDCTHEKMVYGNYVTMKDSKGDISTSKSLPKWATGGYYFGVHVPDREAQILNQMGIWSFSTIVLLLVIGFFAYSLFIILKQKRLSEIQKDFINNMTHEFKTPISTIAVSAQVLKSPEILQQPERLYNYTSIIENENNRLKQHVERVLQMASLDKEEINLNQETIDLHDIVNEVLKSMQLSLNEKEGEITVQLEASNSTITGDRHHITNIVYNLIDNAIKYCNLAPCVEIRTADSNGNILLEVKDNGSGSSTENKKRIFQKFFRVPTGNVHNVKGFGLGLNYVKQIVEAHRGKIVLDSAVGSGSIFKVYLPN
jgi:two-component system phosphate regulon sensor histidine kinase PhoR